MIDCFMPFTAFHYASAIRAIRSSKWTPERIVLLQGAGTTRSLSGQLYADKFRAELCEMSVYFSELNFSRKTVLSMPFLVGRTSMRLVTGNPRRSESLYLSRFSNEVIIVDDGSGSVASSGYFDPCTPEGNQFKKALIKFGILPYYKKLYKKIALHPTIFPNSIFPNSVQIEFTPICCARPDQQESVQSVFVSSFLREEQVDRYICWVRENFDLPDSTVLSTHPALPSERAARLSGELNLPILDTEGVLLEEYITAVASEQEIIVLGQENTSTLIIKQANLARTNTRTFPG